MFKHCVVHNGAVQRNGRQQFNGTAVTLRFRRDNISNRFTVFLGKIRIFFTGYFGKLFRIGNEGSHGVLFHLFRFNFSNRAGYIIYTADDETGYQASEDKIESNFKNVIFR